MFWVLPALQLAQVGRRSRGGVLGTLGTRMGGRFHARAVFTPLARLGLARCIGAALLQLAQLETPRVTPHRGAVGRLGGCCAAQDGQRSPTAAAMLVGNTLSDYPRGPLQSCRAAAGWHPSYLLCFGDLRHITADQSATDWRRRGSGVSDRSRTAARQRARVLGPLAPLSVGPASVVLQRRAEHGAFLQARDESAVRLYSVRERAHVPQRRGAPALRGLSLCKGAPVTLQSRATGRPRPHRALLASADASFDFHSLVFVVAATRFLC
jgi:hypothetical protein